MKVEKTEGRKATVTLTLGELSAVVSGLANRVIFCQDKVKRAKKKKRPKRGEISGWMMAASEAMMAYDAFKALKTKMLADAEQVDKANT